MSLLQAHLLRDYQKRAIAAAHASNRLVVLPTNAGKTIIAASLVEKALDEEDVRKVVFLAPSRPLVIQQAEVLFEQIGRLKQEPAPAPRDGTVARWRLGRCLGHDPGTPHRAMRHACDACECDVATAFETRQLVVLTPALFEKALIHAKIRMCDVALLVVDEAHHAHGNAVYATIFRHFYWRAEEARRPRVLGLTASPVDKGAPKADEVAATTLVEQFEEALRRLEQLFAAAAWSCRVPAEHCPHTERRVVTYAARPPGACPCAATRDLVVLALQHARPDEAAARASLGGVDEAKRLLEAWDRCAKAVVEDLGDALGAWGLCKAAEMLTDDLGKGTRRIAVSFVREEDDLEWGEAKERDGVGGTEQHGRLISEARRRLREGLGTPALQPPAASDAAQHSAKVERLLQHLHETQPRRCLVFVARRACSRLLGELLSEALPGWRVGWTCRPGRVGVSSSHGSQTHREEAHRARLAEFGAPSCESDPPRLLVTTAVIEEGIDVPECDAVVDFDAAGTSRSLQQRAGRARAKGAE